MGSKDVASFVRFEVGDCPVRIREPSFLRILLKPGIVGHERCEVVSSMAGKTFEVGDFMMGDVCWEAKSTVGERFSLEGIRGNFCGRMVGALGEERANAPFQATGIRRFDKDERENDNSNATERGLEVVRSVVRRDKGGGRMER